MAIYFRYIKKKQGEHYLVGDRKKYAVHDIVGILLLIIFMSISEEGKSWCAIMF